MPLDHAKIKLLQNARAQIDRMLAGEEQTAPIELPTTMHKAVSALGAGLVMAALAKYVGIQAGQEDLLQKEIAYWLELFGPPLASAVVAWWVKNGIKLGKPS